MDIDTTSIVAWWGAIIATTVLVWDFIKWKFDGPKLYVDIKPNALYQDSEKTSPQVDENGTESSYIKPSIHVEISNRGTMPTTILSISADRESKDLGTLGMSSIGFKAHNGKNLPHYLLPGDVWSCRVSQDAFIAPNAYGPVIFEIKTGHQDKPIIRALEIDQVLVRRDKMEMIAVNSTAIQAVGYDNNSGRMRIMFEQGDAYDFCNVPMQVYEGLMNASSKGRYYNSYIRDRYQC